MNDWWLMMKMNVYEKRKKEGSIIFIMYGINLQEAVKQRNEEAMSCYTAALNETPPNVSSSEDILYSIFLHSIEFHIEIFCI